MICDPHNNFTKEAASSEKLMYKTLVQLTVPTCTNCSVKKQEN